MDVIIYTRGIKCMGGSHIKLSGEDRGKKQDCQEKGIGGEKEKKKGKKERERR